MRAGTAIDRSSGSSTAPLGEIAARMSRIRADFTFEMPPGRIASSTASTGASRTSSQVANRSRSRK